MIFSMGEIWKECKAEKDTGRQEQTLRLKVKRTEKKETDLQTVTCRYTGRQIEKERDQTDIER